MHRRHAGARPRRPGRGSAPPRDRRDLQRRPGTGCWLNDTPLRLPDGPGLPSAVVSTYLNPGDITSAPLQRVAAAAASLRIRGSGSIELAWIAAGRTHAWLQPNMKPWDRVPGSLLVQEAGGTTSTSSVQGTEWFIAAGRTTHADLLTALREAPAELRPRCGSCTASRTTTETAQAPEGRTATQAGAQQPLARSTTAAG